MGKSIIINGVSFFDNRIPSGDLTPITIYDITGGATTGKYVNTTDGSIGTLVAAAYTRKIPCAGYTDFVLQTSFYYQYICAFYDSNGTFLSGIHENADGNTSYRGAIPNNAHYVIFNYKQTSAPSFIQLQ